MHFTETCIYFDCPQFKEAWELDGPAKLAAARTAKEKGTEFFKQGKFFLAARQYKNVVNFLFTEACT